MARRSRKTTSQTIALWVLKVDADEGKTLAEM